MAKATEEKRSFVLYYDYRKHLQILTDEERGKLLLALMDYGETGKEPELDGAALMAFSFITCQMDRDAEKYAQTCQKRSEAGKRGGRPPKANASGAEEGKPNASNKKQTKAKKANGFSEKQSEAKKADNDNENDTDNDTDNDNDTDTSTPLPPSKGEGKTPSSKAQPDNDEKTPYKAIVDLYHEICKSYPKLRSVSANRKKAIAARWKEYEHCLDTFRELFTKAEASNFLKGESDSTRNWKADFNWLLSGENMAKVLEGKYDNPQNNGSFDIDDFFDAAVRRTYSNSPKSGQVKPRAALERATVARMEENAQNKPKTAAEDETIRKRAELLKASFGS